MDISGRTALVTGASSGLGHAVSWLLAKEGVNVAVGYRLGKDRAEAICHDIEKQGPKAVPVQLDQAVVGGAERAVAEVVQAFDGIDILINNAAMTVGGHEIAPGDLDAFTAEIWDEIMAVNLRGPYLVARAAAPFLSRSNPGSIVNIGSTIGQGKFYADRVFAPSKGAVAPLTRFLAASLAPGVLVNCVAPGLMVETGLGGGYASHVDVWEDAAATNRTTAIEDVARQVVSLCRNSTITGQIIVVDGGVNFQT